ncbi:MAG: GntR family transcriptional regulator [Microbacteriaceae bacterium]|nr:GntR family transcriptional regulator [Microbacteriaceae bacterium]
MQITIDAQSAVAPYEQVKRQLIDRVNGGQLAAGARLPSVRALAEQLGLAANTVARAYRELELDGMIETRGRNGSVVKATGDLLHQRAQDAARNYADTIAQLGIPAAEALALVTAALKSPH